MQRYERLMTYISKRSPITPLFPILLSEGEINFRLRLETDEKLRNKLNDALDTIEESSKKECGVASVTNDARDRSTEGMEDFHWTMLCRTLQFTLR